MKNFLFLYYSFMCGVMLAPFSVMCGVMLTLCIKLNKEFFMLHLQSAPNGNQPLLTTI